MIPTGVKVFLSLRHLTARSLDRFLDDGRIEIDSNIIERAIRPQAIIRKNALFAGSDGDGRTWATTVSLL
jgi:transposase